ncbi:MAG: 50S ribosomal protein L22 [bacterium]
MEYRAKARYVRISPRKMRQVADLVRGKDVEEALNILHFTLKAASTHVEKTIRSAAANAVNMAGSTRVKVEDLYIKEVQVDGGPSLKRFRPRAMGRAARILKRTSHLSVVLAERQKR